MAQTIQDLRDAIAAIQQAVEADIAQNVVVVEAINALLAKIDVSVNQDLTAEVQALASIAAKLASDNAVVQEAIDKALPANSSGA